MHGTNDIQSTGDRNVVFERNREGNFTKNAVLCQNILQYSINGKYKEDDNESFRLWGLTKWLLKINSEFINSFKDLSTRNYTTENRIEYRLPRIKRNVTELVKLGLVVQVGKAKQTKGTGIVDIFQFTELGRVMAWVVESMNPDKREHAVNQIYDLFQDNYREEPASSVDIFCSIYYRKCKERGLFEALVEYYTKVVGAPIPQLGRREFSRRLMMVPKRDGDNSRDFFTLWNDTLMELDENTRKCIFHHLKLEIERKAEEECHAFGTFEKI